MHKPTLVILAAGMGSRYGGLKQLEGVGPSGETIMDYSIFDAVRAGFERAVFVIRPEMESAFRAQIGSRYENRLPVDYAYQKLDALPDGYALPAGRTKPWGTGHAVLAAREVLAGPFAVVNADDFYGARSFAVLGDFLRSPANADPPTYAMVGFTLRDTLSDAGHVNRGCCKTDAAGLLESIEEVVGIERDGENGRYVDEAGATKALAGDTIVSMNTWGFPADFLTALDERFDAFLSEFGDSDKAEFYLPAAVQELMHAGRARVRVLPTSDRWCGVTYPDDKAFVIEMIRALVSEHVYPEKLWA